MKPILDNISAFDVSKETVITFSCANQIFGSKVTIYDHETQNIIADLPISSGMNLQYTIPPNISGLSNGKQYEMVLTIYEDYLFTESNSYQSDRKLFYCFTQPVFQLSPITVSGNYYVVKNSSLTLGIDYSQEEGESLSSYYIVFYDENQKELSNSGELYGIQSTKDVFTVNGLTNKTFYYFRAFGTTKHGMELDTGYLKIFTTFMKYESSMNLNIKNDYCSGEIDGSVYMNVNLYSSDKPVIFENDTAADLKDNILRYDDGLRIGSAFSMYTEVYDLNMDSCFLKLIDEYGHAIHFCYYVYKKYEIDTITEYKPYFSIEIGDQRYVTDFLGSASSIADLADRKYGIALSKEHSIIKLKIKEIT